LASRILLIDDDAIVHKIAQRQIGKDFELFHADSAKEGLMLIDSKKPNLILLDIEMPDINGYQLCKQIRGNEKYNHIAIVFLSGKSSEQDIMLGYELGADDYIVKPFHVDELLKKIKVLEQNQLNNATLTQKAVNPKIAASAPGSIEPAGEFAQVMSFVADSYGIDSLEALAQRFFALSNSWGLNCSVMFSHSGKSGKETFFANNNIVKSLEKEMLLHTKNKGQTLQFGCRMIVNYPQVSVLVKNMPLVSEPKYDFYNEYLVMLSGAINAKVVTLAERQSISRKSQELTDAFVEIRDKLVSLVAVLNAKNGRILRTIRSISKQVDSQLQALDLSQQTQKQLNDITHSLLENIGRDTTDANAANKDLATLTLSMQEVVSRQERFSKSI
jgi:CheY-like chemotaxis protein